MPATLTLDDDVVALLRRHAPTAALSEAANELLRATLTKQLAAWQSIRELQAQTTQALSDSGTSEEQLVEFLENEKHAMRAIVPRQAS